MKIFKKDLPRLRELFLEFKDPVGFKFAQQYLGGYPELEKLLKYRWFKSQWEQWQLELQASIKSKALERIQEISLEGSSQSLNASKYLANGEYLDTVKDKQRGRPTKEEVSGELKRKVQEVETVNEDYKRMQQNTLHVITGGRA
jgi:hypothetical protein